MAERLRRVVQTLGLVAASSLACAFLVEIGLRVLAPQQLVRLRPDLWIPDDGLGWLHRPGLDTTVNTGEREVRFSTDEHGHRIGSRSAPEETYRVLALGDSFVEALQVEYEDSLTGQLERLWTRRPGGRLRVVNAAVGGWDPNHYLIAARRELDGGTYHALLVFLYLGNDVVARRIDHLPPQLPAPRPRLRLPHSLRRAAWIGSVAYPLNERLEARSHLYVLVKNRLSFLRQRLGLAHGAYPIALLLSEAASPRWELTAAICGDIARVAGPERPVVFVLIPAVYQVDVRKGQEHLAALSLDAGLVDLDQPARKLSASLRQQRLRIFDTTPKLREAFRAGEEELYGEVDTHLAPAGHLVVARALEPILFELLEGAEPEASSAP